MGGGLSQAVSRPQEARTSHKRQGDGKPKDNHLRGAATFTPYGWFPLLSVRLLVILARLLVMLLVILLTIFTDFSDFLGRYYYFHAVIRMTTWKNITNQVINLHAIKY